MKAHKRIAFALWCFAVATVALYAIAAAMWLEESRWRVWLVTVIAKTAKAISKWWAI